MKTLPSDLADHLASGATTLCQCWKLTRTDGAEFGFTDHDRPLTFGGKTFEAIGGLEASESTENTGFAIGGLEVFGAIQSDTLDEADLAAGYFDGAEIIMWLVNWNDVGQRVKLRIGHLGEITRADGAFRAEIRGLAHQLDQIQGRTFSHVCDALLGDSRCGVELTAAPNKATGAVLDQVDDYLIRVSGLDGFATGWFSQGLLTWSTGDNGGVSIEVRFHQASDTGALLQLWQAPARAIQVGDTFAVTAGCDKQFATCRQKFQNAVNFRGFPHMPGDDFSLTYPKRDTGKNDGSPLVE